VLGELYTTFSTGLNSQYLFGLGERWQQFKLEPNQVFTIWNKDYPADEKVPNG